MHFTIHNDALEVSIAAKGAELQTLINKQTSINYLWSGDSAFWGKKSPVLFPIVGGLKNNSYHYQGKEYPLPRHGFARDNDFTVVEQHNDRIVFELISNQETKLVYPFDFSFQIIYALENNALSVEYVIQNKDTNCPMYFSVGAHPAFKVPLTADTSFEDYYLYFNETENTPNYPLTADGLLQTVSQPYLNNSQKLALQKELFYKDALVFKSLKSTSISILSSLHNHGLSVSFSGFPYMGIWSAKDANFVCIEPWLGIADSENSNGSLIEKEGIISLAPTQKFSAMWQVSVF